LKIAKNHDQGFDLALIEAVETASPSLASLLIGAKQLCGKLPNVLVSMIEVDDLDGARKVSFGQIPI
jgi:hypothetical protein